MKESNNYEELIIKSFYWLLLSSLVLTFFSVNVTSINASGSAYAVGEIATTVSSVLGSGSKYSAQSQTVSQQVSLNSQGSQTFVQTGLAFGNVSIPLQDPVINYVYIEPQNISNDSSVQIIISAAYTQDILVTIINPNSDRAYLNFSISRDQYYDNISLIGRYYVNVTAIGISTVYASSYFDVYYNNSVNPSNNSSENSESSTSRSRSSKSSRISSLNRFNVSSIHSCDDGISTFNITSYSKPVSSADVFLYRINEKGVTEHLGKKTDSNGTTSIFLLNGNYTLVLSKYGYYDYITQYFVNCSLVENISEDVLEESLSDTNISSNSTFQNITVASGYLELEENSSLSEEQIPMKDDSFRNNAFSYRIFASMTLLCVVFIVLILARKKYALPNLKSKKPVIEKSLIENSSTSVDVMKSNNAYEEKIESATIAPLNIVPSVMAEPKIHSYLSPVPEGKEFVLRDSRKIDSLQSLCSFLESCTDDDFYYHVTSFKNDFAHWIYDVIGDVELSSALGPIKNKLDTCDTLKSRIAVLKQNAVL